MKVLNRTITHYEEAIQHILHENKATQAVSATFPEKLPGDFNFFQRMLGRDRPYSRVYALEDYPYNWSYINITYQIWDKTVYLLTLESRSVM